jgi:hypothetical protein
MKILKLVLVVWLLLVSVAVARQEILRLDKIVIVSTASDAIDVAGGVNAGTGNVNVIGTDGRIPAINSTYFADTQGATPSGAVMFFALASCPSGWSDLTASHAGRYIVAKHADQTAGTGIGTPLTSGENRAAGQHNHATVVTDPGHAHDIQVYERDTDFGPGQISDNVENGVGDSTESTASATTGITVSVSNGGSATAGTNAPYLALLLCQKN